MQFKQKFFTIETGRMLGYELLRYLALIGLVIYHVGYHWTSNFKNTNFYRITSIWDQMVPAIFAFISGFFLIKSSRLIMVKSTVAYFVYWLINLITISFLCLTINYSTGNWIWEVLKLGGRDWWFFRNMLFIYLITPIICCGFKYINKWYLLFFVSTTYCINIFFGIFHTHGIIDIQSILALLTFFLLGCWWRSFGIDLFGRKTTIIYSVILVTVIYTIWTTMQYLPINYQLFDIYKNFGLTFLWIIPVVNLFSFIKIKNNKTAKIISVISLISNFVYLFEAIFEYIVLKYITFGIHIIELKYIISSVLVVLFTTLFGLLWTFPARYSINFISFYLNKMFVIINDWLSRISKQPQI